MDNTEAITVLSLCSGYGGLELGLARALARPLRVVAVEVEAYALANLVAKAEETVAYMICQTVSDREKNDSLAKKTP